MEDQIQELHNDLQKTPENVKDYFYVNIVSGLTFLRWAYESNVTNIYEAVDDVVDRLQIAQIVIQDHVKNYPKLKIADVHDRGLYATIDVIREIDQKAYNLLYKKGGQV